MTVITLATVGFMEVQPLSQNGRIFTIFIILGGMGILLYTVSTVTAFIVEGALGDILRRKKMEKKIEKMNNHFIICGAGETGWYVIKELLATKKEFVIIENIQERINKLSELGQINYLLGNATEDSILIKAGIKRARGLVSVLAEDQDNLFVVLSARELNPNLRIIARTVYEKSIHKLRKAGADGVITPSLIGGLRMASELIRPHVVSFLDQMMRTGGMTLRFEEAKLIPDSPMIGKTLGETKIPEKTGLIVVAVKDGVDMTYHYNPTTNTRLKEGDVLIVMGNVEQVKTLHECIGCD